MKKRQDRNVSSVQRTTKSRPYRLKSLHAILAASFITANMTAANAAVISYDGSMTPDSAGLPAPFSWNVFSGTTWSTSNGVLTMTTTSNAGIWFGNTQYWRPVPWQLADPQAGNAVTARVKVGLDSGEFVCWLYDGTHAAFLEFNVGYVAYWTSTDHFYPGRGTTHRMETTDGFHDYELHLHSGYVTYSVDGAQVYSGPAMAYDPAPYGPAFGIGDQSGRPTPTGFGTLFIDALIVSTEVDRPVATIRCSQVEVCWGSVTNKTYQPQYRSTLTTNLWTNLGAPISGRSGNTCVQDDVPLNGPHRLYRVVVLP